MATRRSSQRRTAMTSIAFSRDSAANSRLRFRTGEPSTILQTKVTFGPVFQGK